MTFSTNNYNQNISNLTNIVNGLHNSIAALQAAPPISGRNVIVNSTCGVAQVNGATLITPLTATYPIDNVRFGASVASRLQTQMVTNKLNTLGASTALQVSVLAQYTPTSTNEFTIAFPIEGLNFARFQYGTSNAKFVSLQFKVNVSVAGTYSGSIQNANATRTYPFSFYVPANTDTLVTIPSIIGCTDGTWLSTAATSAYVYFNLGSVESFKTFNNNNNNNSGNWIVGDFTGILGSTNFVSQVNGSTYAISEVQLELGPVCTPFERKLYNQEFSACQRYLFGLSTNDVVTGACFSTTGAVISVPFKVTMRVPPTGLSTTGTMANNILWTAPSGNLACTAITFSSAGTNSASIDATVAGGLTSGTFASLLPNAGSVYFTGSQI